MKRINNKTLIILSAALAGVLLIFWVIFFVLRAGSDDPVSSGSSSLAAITPSSQAQPGSQSVLSLPGSGSQDSSMASSAPVLTTDPVGFISILPEGPYTPVDASTADKLVGSWLWAPQPAGQGTGTTYQFRFGEPEGYMMLSVGDFGSGSGSYYRGQYTVQSDGLIVASLQESYADAPADLPMMHITFRAEWVPNTYDALIITLLTLSTEKVEDAEHFNGLIDRQLPYFRYTG